MTRSLGAAILIAADVAAQPAPSPMKPRPLGEELPRVFAPPHLSPGLAQGLVVEYNQRSPMLLGRGFVSISGDVRNDCIAASKTRTVTGNPSAATGQSISLSV